MTLIHDLMKIQAAALPHRGLLEGNARKAADAEAKYRRCLLGAERTTGEVAAALGHKNVPNMLRTLEARGLVRCTGTRQNPGGGRPMNCWTWVGA